MRVTETQLEAMVKRVNDLLRKTNAYIELGGHNGYSSVHMFHKNYEGYPGAPIEKNVCIKQIMGGTKREVYFFLSGYLDIVSEGRLRTLNKIKPKRNQPAKEKPAYTQKQLANFGAIALQFMDSDSEDPESDFYGMSGADFIEHLGTFKPEKNA